MKRVEAADRNQAVIVHTATGGHLRQLQSLFADVMTSESLGDLDVPVENLRNLGPTTAAWLRQIGIHTRADLETFGPVHTYIRIKQRQPKASLNLLWALAAALADRDWQDLSEDEKEELRREVEES